MVVRGILLGMLLITGLGAQPLTKPSFGNEASTPVRRLQVSVTPSVDAGAIERLRQRRSSPIAVSILPQGGINVHADRRALATMPIKASSAQNVGSVAIELGKQVLQQAGIRAPALQLDRQWQDEKGYYHAALLQHIAGIPIWSSDVRVHFASDGTPYWIQGAAFPTDALPVLTDAIGPDGARQRAKEHLSRQRGLPAAPDQWSTRRVIFPERVPPWRLRSCWQVTAYPDGLHRWEVFVDTETGEIVFAYNNTHRDGPSTAQATDLMGQQRTINTYQYRGTYYMLDASRPMYNPSQSQLPDRPIGAILTLTANNTDLQRIAHITSSTNTWTNPTAVSAHANAGVAYEYYRTTHSRNSLDGQGGTIFSIIHVTHNGRPMDNAFWNGKVMAYGDGHVAFRPLARGLDVAAHELTHGVIEHSANLIYLSQSGAINESMADVFAVMVDREDWLVGEDVVSPAYFPSGAMRSFIDPHNGGSGPGSPGWQPRHMSEYQRLPETEEGDNGGVHINSGIPNHACYLLAQQIGREKTERIYYRALVTYLRQNSQFLDLRRAIIQAARDLYGEGAETQAAASAFDAVGITDGGSGGSTPRDYEPVAGADRLLVYSPSDAALYVFDNANSPAGPRQVSSNAGIFSRPSVTDDGIICIFVAADNTLRACALTSPTIQEQVLDPTPIWRSIAISPDGRRLAATTTAYDPTIYVINLETQPPSVRSFRLYTPNYSGDTSSSQLVFADALQWNLDGQTLLFDALNATPTEWGDTLVYWDILQLHAWDRTARTFGSGVISRVLPTQPLGISIGNPTYAKNSPSIIAFDRYDDNTGQYAVMAANLNTQTIEKISDNTTLGYPSYRGDDARLAVTAISTQGVVGIAAFPLDATKIRPAGNPQWLVTNGVVPIYFRVGQRPMSAESFVNDVKVTIEPLPATEGNVSIIVPADWHEWKWIIRDAVGRLLHEGKALGSCVLFPTNNLASGTYYCTVVGETEVITRPFVVLR